MDTKDTRMSSDQVMHGLVDTIIQGSAATKPWLRDAILYCSIPHWFDEQVIQGIRPIGEDENISDKMVLDELRTMPFCQEHPIRGWTYHEDIRSYLLSRPEVEEHGQEWHGRAAATFERLLKETGVEGEERFKNIEWKDLAVEWLYHLFHTETSAALKMVRRFCAEALAVETFGGNWEVRFCAEFLGSLDLRSLPEQIGQEVSALTGGVEALLAYRDGEAIEMLYSLVEETGLSEKQEGSLRSWIGEIHLDNEGRLAPALEQQLMADQLMPEHGWVYSNLAEIYNWPTLMWAPLDLAQEYAAKATELAPNNRGYKLLGDTYKKQEEWNKAIEQYEKQTSEGSAYEIDALFGLSEAYAGQGETEKGIEQLDKIVIIDPSFQYAVLVRKGNIYRDAGKWDDAGTEYERALKVDPSQPFAFSELGYLYYLKGQSAKAEEVYQKVLELEPDAAASYTSLALLYSWNGKWGKAGSICRQALERGIVHTEVLTVLSDIYNEQGRIEDMKQVYERLARLDPGHRYFCHCKKGDAYLTQAWQHREAPEKEQLVAQARGEFEKALEYGQGRAWAYASLMELAILQNDPTAIENWRRKVTEEAPWAYYDTLVRLGEAYRKNYQADEAENILKTAIELAPRRTAAWYELERLFSWSGDLGAVERAWSNLIDIDPSLAYDAHISTGFSFAQIADYAQARSEYIKAREMQPEKVIAYLRLAEIDTAVGELDDAVENYRQAADIAPDFAARSYTDIAEIRRQQGRYDDMEKAARAAILFDVEAPAGYIELARLGIETFERSLIDEARERLIAAAPDKLYDFDYGLSDAYRLTGNETEAQHLYEACIERDSERVEAHLGLAMLLIDQEQYDEARMHLEKAREIDSTDVDVYYGVSQWHDIQEDVKGVVEIQQHIARMAPAEEYNTCLSIGQAYENVDQPDKANEIYEAAIKLAPWRSEAYASLASVLLRQEKIEEAKSTYQTAMQMADISPEDLGYYYELREKFDDAFALYKLGIETAPAEADAYYLLADLLVGLDKAEEAVEVYRQMAQQPGLVYDAYLSIGNLRIKLQEHDQAAEIFRQAIEKDPKRPEAYVGLAQFLKDQEQFEEAIGVCRQMAQQPELAYNAYISIGNLKSDMKEYGEAEASYRQALEIDPQQVDAYREMASLYFEQQEPGKAEQSLQRALEVAPEDPDTLGTMGQLLERQERWDEAIQAYRSVAELQPETASTAYERIGDLLIKQERYVEAEAALRQSVRGDPGNAGAYFSLGIVSEAQDEWAQAREMYSKATEINPRYGDAYVALGRVYGQLGDVKSISSMAQRLLALDLDPEEAYDARLVIAASYREANVTEMANDAYRQAIEMDPRRPDAYIELAQMLAEQGQTEEAISVCRQMAQQPDLAYDAYILVGNLETDLNEFGEAAKDYQQAIELDAQKPDAYFGLSQISIVQKQFKEAAGVFRQMAQQPELAYDANVLIGFLNIELKEFEQAAASFQNALKIDPQKVDAYLGMVSLYLDQNKTSDAERYLLQALEISPKDPDVFGWMGRLRQQEGKSDEAIQAYRRVAELQTESSSTAYEFIGDLLIKQDRYDEAEEALRQAVDRDPGNAGAYYSLGQLSEMQVNLEQARDMYSKVIEINPDYGDAYVALVSVYRQLGDVKSVTRLSQQITALELDPVEEYYARLEIAVTYLDANLYEWAIDELNGALAIERIPDDSMADGYIWLARIYEQQGRRTMADESYRKSIDIGPEKSVAYIELAQMLADRGEIEEAIDVCRQMAQQPEIAYEAFISIGDLETVLKDYDEAAKSYQRALEIDPRKLGAYQGMASLSYEQNRLSASEQYLRQALEVAPDDPDTLGMLGQLLEGQGRWDEAVRAYRGMVEQRPETASGTYERIGDLLIQQEKYSEAKTALRQAVQKDPENAGAYFSLGQLCEVQEDWLQAVQMYTKAAEINPKYSDVYTALGRVYARSGDVESITRMAQQILASDLDPVEEYYARLVIAASYGGIDVTMAYNAYQEAIEVDPESPDAYVELAQMLADQGQIEEAVRVCRQMAKQPELAYDAYISIGNLKFNLEEYDQAVASYEQALELDPQRVDAYHRIASLSYEQNDTGKAEQYLRQALEAVPEDSETFMMMGQLLAEQERWDEAVQVYQGVAKLQPEVSSVAYERIGDLYIQQERYSEAEAALRKVVQWDPGSEVAYFSLGQVCEVQEDLEQAKEMYVKATELNPKYGNAYIALGRIYAQLDDLKSMDQMAQQILASDLNPAEAYDARLVVAAIYREANMAAARDVYQQVIEINPERPEAYIEQAQLLVEQGKLEEAIEVCRQMAQQPELAYDAYISIGKLQAALEDPDQEAASYRQALEIDPQRLDAYQELASFYYELNDTGKAEQYLQQALEVVPEDPDTLWMMEQLQGRLGAG